MSHNIKYKQDMPRKGGYDPIQWYRKQPKKGYGNLIAFTGLFGFTCTNLYLYLQYKDRLDWKQHESMEARVIMEPFVLSERNRLFLRHMRRKREAEENLMKDVEGWELGKWWDVNVYHNPRNLWLEPSMDEFYALCNYKDKKTRAKTHNITSRTAYFKDEDFPQSQ